MSRRSNADMSNMTPEQEEEDRLMVACRLIAFRETVSSTQTDFFRNAGLPYQTGNHYERGYALPSLNYARILGRRYGLSLDYLYDGKMHGLPQDVAARISKRLPVVISDFRARLAYEKSKNERAGLGHMSNQQLANARERVRIKTLYADAKAAKEAKEKIERKATKKPIKKK